MVGKLKDTFLIWTQGEYLEHKYDPARIIFVMFLTALVFLFNVSCPFYLDPACWKHLSPGSTNHNIYFFLGGGGGDIYRQNNFFALFTI